MNNYQFVCNDTTITIKAFSEDEAWIKLGTLLTKGVEEIYALNDFKLEECSDLY